MEESRGGGEVRKIHIVYFLSDNGKIDQPHLIRVNRLNRHGVRLRDVKRWLSQTRGQDMPESFAWSYKRSYRGGYVWQDLIDNDLITAISDNEYVLKGSLLPSHTKTMDPFLDGEKPPIKEQAEKREQLMMDENKLSSEEMNSKDEFFRIGSIWLKETNSEEEDSSVTVVNKKLKKKKKKIGSDLIKRNFIGCMTVETKGSAHRVVQQTEDSSVSGSSQGSNSSKSSREKPATKGKGSVSEASRRSTGSSLL